MGEDLSLCKVLGSDERLERCAIENFECPRLNFKFQNLLKPFTYFIPDFGKVPNRTGLD
jgi:hypothetical protein